MELVYLWVENYKNIHHQGFNFSPRFHCEYNDKSKELTIDENKNYIHIFPDNINITAIVGKNGSGKSSVAEIIATFSYQEFLDEESFLVFFNGKEFLFKQGHSASDLKFTISNLTKYGHQNKSIARTVSILYFGNELSTIFNNTKMRGIKSYEGNINAFKEVTKNIPNLKNTINKEKNDRFEIFTTRFHSILKENKNILKNLDNIFMFNTYRRELHFYEMIPIVAVDENFNKLIELELKDSRKSVLKLNSSADISLYKLLIIFRLTQYEKDRNKIIEEILDKFINKDFSKKSFLNIFEIINKYDKKSDIYTGKNIKGILNRYKYINNEIWIEKNPTPIETDIDLEIENSLLKLLKENNIERIEFLNDLDYDFTYFSLSSGERNYIEIFVTYIYQLLLQDKMNNHNRKSIFFFDEIDLGLHPNWQKRLIKDIVFYTNKYFSHSIQLFFTSHSPFLLSDIPKQNIIFLDKDKKGKCKVLLHDEVLSKKQTFGANIHTLLSDSFFMEEGLMGEFAKGKINEIKEFYEKVEKEDKKEKSNFTLLIKEYEDNIIKFEQIQSIIGEPFLKTIVKNQLEEIETILFKDKAKQLAIQRFIKEFGKDAIISEVMSDDKD